MARKKIDDKRKSVPLIWTGNRPPLKHSDFRIGCEFLSGSGRWRCTDVGVRTIAAIRLNHDDEPSWYNGPPYAVVQHVFDEYDIEGCERAPKRRTYDASGRTALKVAARPAGRAPAKERQSKRRAARPR